MSQPGLHNESKISQCKPIIFKPTNQPSNQHKKANFRLEENISNRLQIVQNQKTPTNQDNKAEGVNTPVCKGEIHQLLLEVTHQGRSWAVKPTPHSGNHEEGNPVSILKRKGGGKGFLSCSLRTPQVLPGRRKSKLSSIQ